MARKKVAETNDTGEKQRFEKMAAICEKVPEHPRETLHEALQSLRDRQRNSTNCAIMVLYPAIDVSNLLLYFYARKKNSGIGEPT